MKSANFSNRKSKARIIASSTEDDDDSLMQDPSSVPTVVLSSSTIQKTNEETTVSAPALFKRKSSSTKARKVVNRSLLSLDDPHEQGDDDIATEESTTRRVVVKKSTLSRQAIERNASSKPDAATSSKPRLVIKPSTSSSSAASLPSRSLEQLSLSSISRPSYSKEALQELKTLTPTTLLPVPHPKDEGDEDILMSDATATAADPLNIAGKFAVERATPANQSSLIPDEGTIKALKARRAMLAQNPDYISLTEDPYSGKSSGSRLQPIGDEGEELLLETFVEDGGLAVGRKAQREKERRRRADIREAIDMVEQPDGDGDGLSEDGENSDGEGEWETDRIRAGGYGSSKRETLEEKLRRPPVVITPLPNFADAVARLKGILAGMNEEQEQKARIVEELVAEREMIEVREKEVQEMLKATTEKYERLKLEAGGALHLGRGLESFGEDGTAV